MYRLIYMAPILAGLWFVDSWLSDDGYVGWERNTVRNAQRRWETRPTARIAIMGSSTSKDWLSIRSLAQNLGVDPSTIVDAHMNGCHQDCTWAQVRLIKQRHALKRCRWQGKNRCSPPKVKPFDAVFFGINLFQMCENSHSKRALQQVMLLPRQDIPELFDIYTSAKEPLLHIGRFVGVQMSQAYGDTRALRDYWGQKWFGIHKSPRSHAWYRSVPKKKKKKIKSCDYEDESIALKRRFTESLLDDFGDIATTTYLMILPDSSLSIDESKHQKRWTKHLELHQRMADERPWVHLVDLASKGLKTPEKYHDGFHLKREFYTAQQKLLHRELKAVRVGPVPARRDAKP